MNGGRDTEYWLRLLCELRALAQESEWVEFKRSYKDPDKIGEYLSALANAAALLEKPKAYVVWGVENESHEIVGTSFRVGATRKGSEDLEPWLQRLVFPQIDFRFNEFECEGQRIVLLEIPCAVHQPVQFKGTEFIRVGSHTKKLKDFPEKERALWRLFDQAPFERGIALESVQDDQVLRLLDYRAYFTLLNLVVPQRGDAILNRLAEDRMVGRTDGGLWNVTNLGAILIAKKLDVFNGLKRKAVRVVQYRGNNRLNAVREQVGTKGYASGFEGLVGFVNDLIPTNEVMGKALRKDVPMYPELAVRELVANAVIHQDFQFRGAGPMIEIFSDRMEITNPGVPLVETERFLDTPPQSRNEDAAGFMRRAGVCEERGSGIDKVVAQTELYQLPAPLFEVVEGQTRAVLFAHKKFNDMDPQDRLRACYLHACLKYANREFMTNTTLRERFGLTDSKRDVVSRIIRDATAANLIRPTEESVRKYMPAWA